MIMPLENKGFIGPVDADVATVIPVHILVLYIDVDVHNILGSMEMALTPALLPFIYMVPRFSLVRSFLDAHSPRKVITMSLG